MRRRRDTNRDEFNSYFDPKRDTKVLIHGWQSSSKSDTIQSIMMAYLEMGDYNVIGMRHIRSISVIRYIISLYIDIGTFNGTFLAVDWSSLSSNMYYGTPARQTKDVGTYTAEMIDYLCQEQGANTDNFHIVGHSLGAHTAGYAGAYTKSGKIPRITGKLEKL